MGRHQQLCREGGNPEMDEEALLADMPSFVSEAAEGGQAKWTNSPSLSTCKCSRGTPPLLHATRRLRPGGQATEAISYSADSSLRPGGFKKGAWQRTSTLGAQESRNMEAALAPGPTATTICRRPHPSGSTASQTTTPGHLTSPTLMAPMQRAPARTTSQTARATTRRPTLKRSPPWRVHGRYSGTRPRGGR